MLITDHELDHHRMDDDGASIVAESHAELLSVSRSRNSLVVNIRIPDPDRVSVIIDGVLASKTYNGDGGLDIGLWTLTVPISPSQHDVQVIATSTNAEQFVLHTICPASE